MNAADGGAGVLVGRGSHGAGVENHESGLRRLGGAFQAALPQLALDGRAVRLGGPAAEICHVESRHVSILTQPDAGRFDSLGARQESVSAARTPPPADEIRLGIGKREEGELAADSGIVYKFWFKIKPRPLAVSAGNIPGRTPDAPALA